MEQATKRRLILILFTGLLTLAADQGTKQMARAWLRGAPTVEVIPGYLALEYHENPGMAFGMGRDWPAGRYVLIGVGLAALVLVWRLVQQVGPRQRTADIAYALVAGGAVGNLVDRVYLGRVVDFVVMHWQRKAQWPAYNVADAALVAGVLLLILVLGRKEQPHGEPGKKTERTSAGKRSRR